MASSATASVPLPSLSHPAILPVVRGAGPNPFVDLGLFSVSRMIWFLVLLTMVVTVALWNKVSSASPYIDDVRSGVGEGPVRV
jgi:hypothetical protein